MNYTALDANLRQIRLLRVKPSDHHQAQVACEIFIRELQDPPPEYAALSYVWGNPTDTQEITVDGCVFQATKNLVAALKQYRASSFTATNGEPLLLWADAVCINQKDAVEKGQQVAMMGSIYTAASRVISWLGPSSDSTESGIALIKACVRDWEDCGERMGVPIEDLEERDIAKFEFIGRLPEFCEKNTEQGCGNKAWNAVLGEISGNIYWTRIWIVQELVLAQRPSDHIVFCGVHTMTFRELDLFLVFVLIFQRLVPKKPAYFDRDIWIWVSTFPNTTILPMYMVRMIKNQDMTCDCGFLLWINEYCKSTNPHDAVFGLSGILKDGIVPDYNKRLVDVYRDCVSALLPDTEFVGDLFDRAGLLLKDRDNFEFPSWVPRLNTLKEDRRYMVWPKQMLSRWFDTTFSEGPKAVDERTMRFSGVELDRCTRVFPLYGDYSPDCLDINEAGKALWWLCLSFVGEYRNEYPWNGLSALEDLHNALHQGLDVKENLLQITYPEHSSSSLVFGELLRRWEPEVDDKAAEQRLRSFGYASLEQVRVAFDEALMGHEATRPQATESITLQDDPDMINNYSQATLLKLHEWILQPLFRTEKGRMGRAPPAIAEGDLICYLEGIQTPYLLRKLDDGVHYVLVGTCHVNGYSNGEPVESLKKGDLTLKHFYVR